MESVHSLLSSSSTYGASTASILVEISHLCWCITRRKAISIDMITLANTLLGIDLLAALAGHGFLSCVCACGGGGVFLI